MLFLENALNQKFSRNSQKITSPFLVKFAKHMKWRNPENFTTSPKHDSRPARPLPGKSSQKLWHSRPSHPAIVYFSDCSSRCLMNRETLKGKYITPIRPQNNQPGRLWNLWWYFLMSRNTGNYRCIYAYWEILFIIHNMYIYICIYVHIFHVCICWILWYIYIYIFMYVYIYTKNIE